MNEIRISSILNSQFLITDVIPLPAAVRKQIAASRPDPVYLLQGEDDVEKSALAHEFEELVEDGLRAFNVERIYTADLTSGDKIAAAVSSIATAVRTLPMMAPRRVVIVFQADGLLVPEARERCGHAGARRARDAAEESRAADHTGSGRGHHRQAKPDVQAARAAGHPGRMRGARVAGRRRALGSQSSRAGGRRSRLRLRACWPNAAAQT